MARQSRKYSLISPGKCKESLDFTQTRRLHSNLNLCFQGPVKVGSFDIPGDLARGWIALPPNPNGRPNSDVLRPWANELDLSRRPSDTWIVDFGSRDEMEASFYEAPFEFVRTHVNRQETGITVREDGCFGGNMARRCLACDKGFVSSEIHCYSKSCNVSLFCLAACFCTPRFPNQRDIDRQ